MHKDWLLIKHVFLLETKSYFRSKYLRFSILHSYLFVPLALFILNNKMRSNDLLTIFWTCILVLQR